MAQGAALGRRSSGPTLARRGSRKAMRDGQVRSLLLDKRKRRQSMGTDTFMTAITCSIAAFLVAVTLLLALRSFAEAVGLVDRPGGRKSHNGDVPVIGGLSMFGGLVIAAVGGEQLGHHGVALLATAAFMVFLGALDDRFSLSPSIRLFAQLTAASALVYGTRYQVTSLGDLFGTGPIMLGAFALPFTLVSTVALINAFNMLDGLDGLAGGVALAGFGGVSTIAVTTGVPTALLISTSMVGALTGFLIFNVPARFNRPLRTFMGDAGSTLLGFLLAGIGLTLIQPTTVELSPSVVLWLMPIPIFELFATTYRRARSGVSPTKADANHFHHKLLRAGFSVRCIFAVYVVVSFGSAAIAVEAARAKTPDVLLFASFIAAFLGWLLFIASAPRLARYLPRKFRRDGEIATH